MLEALDVILRLFRGEVVTETTEWYTLVNARVHLLPYTRPHPEVSVASALSGGARRHPAPLPRGGRHRDHRVVHPGQRTGAPAALHEAPSGSLGGERGLGGRSPSSCASSAGRSSPRPPSGTPWSTHGCTCCPTRGPIRKSRWRARSRPRAGARRAARAPPSSP